MKSNLKNNIKMKLIKFNKNRTNYIF